MKISTVELMYDFSNSASNFQFILVASLVKVSTSCTGALCHMQKRQETCVLWTGHQMVTLFLCLVKTFIAEICDCKHKKQAGLFSA